MKHGTLICFPFCLSRHHARPSVVAASVFLTNGWTRPDRGTETYSSDFESECPVQRIFECSFGSSTKILSGKWRCYVAAEVTLPNSGIGGFWRLTPPSRFDRSVDRPHGHHPSLPPASLTFPGDDSSVASMASRKFPCASSAFPCGGSAAPFRRARGNGARVISGCPVGKEQRVGVARFSSADIPRTWFAIHLLRRRRAIATRPAEWLLQHALQRATRRPLRMP